MGALVKMLSMAAIGLIIVVVAYLVFRGLGSWRQGYSWKEMDWHGRGRTSIVDFFEASDIGRRFVVRDGKKCAEYYAYKDGMPIKVICPKQN